MHSEHLNNVRLNFVGIGWFIAMAVTSLLLFVFVAAGLLSPDGDGGGRLILIAVAIGFAAGGVFVGFMTALAPVLHGILMGLTTLLVWAVLNAVVSFLPNFTWTQLDATLAVNLMLVQIVAAIIGTRFGYRFTAPSK